MFSSLIPIPKQFQSISSPYDLKERLEWGEPALTIIDVRSREEFNQGRISGAVSAPVDQLSRFAMINLEFERDIYVYGHSDEQTAEAATLLREAGFERVAQLKEGLSGWAVINGAVEM